VELLRFLNELDSKIRSFQGEHFTEFAELISSEIGSKSDSKLIYTNLKYSRTIPRNAEMV